MSNVDYKGSVTLISGLTQANNSSFPLVDGDAVQYKQEINEDGTFKSVSQKLSEFNRSYEYATSDDIDGILNGLFGQYKRLSLTGDTMLENTFEDQLKILSVNGNSYYQPTSNNIVPTPEKPIPIINKKTNIKRISPNVFGLEKESDTSNIPDSGTYRSIGQHQLKANTKYIFSWSEATVPAKATLSFQIQDEKGTVLVSSFTYFNLESNEKEEAGKEVEFTTNSSGIVKFAYNCTVATSNTTETYQQYWYTKILKDISLKEDVEYEPEYIELRSLKETINKFDLGLLSQTNLITNSGAYRKINIPITLKPNTRYKIYYEKSMIPALTWSVLNIVDNTEKILATILNVKNTENNEVEKQAINIAFTSPIDGEIYFSYFVQSFNAEGVQVPQNTEVFKEKWFTKILKNIMITEESLNQTTYVAPTIRDYKIVDHTAKTTKIVRNVGTRIFDGSEDEKWESVDSLENTIRFRIELSTAKNNSEGMCSNNTWVTSGVSLDKSVIGVSGGKIYYRLPKTVLNSLDLENFKMWLQQNPFTICYELLTQTEETITYVETDTSEVGYSWQDTTSPSPGIPSNIESVNSIEVTVCGKNLFDINKVEAFNQDYSIANNGDGSITVNTSSSSSGVVSNQKLSELVNLKSGETYMLTADTTGSEKKIYLFEAQLVWDFGTSKIITQEMLDSRITFYASGESTSAIITNIQIEKGQIATEYEPYKPPQFLSYQLVAPLKGINNTKDIIDIESNQRTDNLTTFVLDDKTIKSIILGTTKEKTQVFQLGISDIFNNNDIWCDKLKNDSNKDEELFTCQSGELYIAIYKGRLETVDVDGFKKWLKDNPLTFTGSATTPTQEALPEDLPTELNKLKTNDGSTAIYINGEVKPSLNIEYKGT